MRRIAWLAAALLFLASAELFLAAADEVCSVPSDVDFIVPIPATCSIRDSEFPAGVIEGDETTLLRAVNLVHKNQEEYISILFYASWCPFSKIFKPNFRKLSTVFPSIRHFAFEESVIRPSILARYSVHGYPTLFLLNSTMRVRYRGPRTLSSLIAFYNNVTSVNPASLNSLSVEETVDPSDLSNLAEESEQENCPFSWARSPEKLLQKDNYLLLAVSFLLLRLVCFLFPRMKAFASWIWSRHLGFATLGNLEDYLRAYVDQAKQGLSQLNPCKRGNLYGARAWASKSLVSVAIGESSSGRSHSASERR
ncbi:5'-adenylylsulfate reductase-like 5 [Rhynchospora pubera]|uniref:5'-adenylylsulfate reductase-like 5 n=1 Tax=Rhynchospora pubera TaxID=906938 RepID=A0AAV8HBI3_9POAL|nr:5'-adenylylsulfate reductase-like 5 [Rhynchospora pubera]